MPCRSMLTKFLLTVGLVLIEHLGGKFSDWIGFYVKNCPFEHLTRKNYPETGPATLACTPPHCKVEMIEPPVYKGGQR